MLNYFILLIISVFTNRCLGHNLVITASDKGFFRKCNTSQYSNLNLKDFAQLNLEEDFADDAETLVINGNLTILASLPQDSLMQLHMDFLKWNRGRWENTIYTIKRDDFCAALFSPSELWYPLTKNIPEEERVCPPEKGTVYHFVDFENRIELENLNFALEGEYKIVSKLKSGPYETCIEAIVDIWKN